LVSLATCREAAFPYSNLRGYTIYIDAANKLLILTGGNTNAWSAYEATAAVPVFANGVWRHLAITISRTNSLLSVYTDGVFRESKSCSYISTVDTSRLLRIGAGGDSSPPEFLVRNGTLIDDFRLYNRVLTASEISAIYTGVGTDTINDLIALTSIGVGSYYNTSAAIEHVTMNLEPVSLPTFS
jgi:hypothetical protein